MRSSLVTILERWSDRKEFASGALSRLLKRDVKGGPLGTSQVPDGANQPISQLRFAASGLFLGASYLRPTTLPSPRHAAPEPGVRLALTAAYCGSAQTLVRVQARSIAD
jgi:hypothetical protein